MMRRLIILKSVLRNFGGKRDTLKTLDFFKHSLGCADEAELRQFYRSQKDNFNSTSLIQQNLQDKNCRNIMVIVDSFEHAIEYAEGIC
jgi:hypothetical protein